MQRLPPEIKLRLIDLIVWEKEYVALQEQSWNDGDLRVELLAHHPLRRAAEQRYASTRPLETLCALSLSCREMHGLCKVFFDQLSTGYAAPALKGVRLLSLDIGSPTLDAVLANLGRHNANLAALCLSEQFFREFADILRCLPQQGGQLIQAKLVYQEELLQPGQLAATLESLRQCQNLEVLHLDYFADEASGETLDWAYAAVRAVHASLKYAYIDGNMRDGDEAPRHLPPEPELSMSMSRLTRLEFHHLDGAGVHEAAALALVESASASLEYLTMHCPYDLLSFERSPNTPQQPPACFFPRLEYVALRLECFDAVLPKHWEVPALRSYTCDRLTVDDLEGKTDAYSRLRDRMPALEHLVMNVVDYRDGLDEKDRAWIQDLIRELQHVHTDVTVDFTRYPESS